MGVGRFVRRSPPVSSLFRNRRASVMFQISSFPEGVSELLICYPLWMWEWNRTAGEIACNDDYTSSALSLLPRHGYCASRHHARREATVSVPGMPGAWADISARVRVRWAIA